MKTSVELYRDIAGRTDGDIYIGVVGPVRTGKSTFIKQFMQTMILPNVEGEHRQARMRDELPLSGSGKTIMTTQPKFIPGESAFVQLRDHAGARVRLIDCVGYLVPGALGTQEGGAARMVRTPWFDHDIPFEKAAETGTRKVIANHATLGIVVTTDGSVADIPRTPYIEAEERVVRELKALGKPFLIVLNAKTPDSEAVIRLSASLREKYDVPVFPMNVDEMDTEQANALMENLLLEFPLTEVMLTLPAWVSALNDDHWLTQTLIQAATLAAQNMRKLRDHIALKDILLECEHCADASPTDIRLGTGAVDYAVTLTDGLFYRVLGEASGQTVEGEEHLLRLMTEMTQAKRAYDRIAEAMKSVEESGYGLVSPSMTELTLSQPEIVKQGGKFGVRLQASAPSLHLVRVDIGTEVNPIVGTQQQSEELVEYLLSEFESDPGEIWNTNIFGKSLSDLMREGLSGKLTRMSTDVQGKVREALTKVINEGSGGMICILL